MNTEKTTDAQIRRLQSMYTALLQITIRAQLNPPEIAQNAESTAFCMQEVLELVKEIQESEKCAKQENGAKQEKDVKQKNE